MKQSALSNYRSQFNRANYRSLLAYFIFSLLLTAVVEIFARRSFLGAFGFFFSRPHIFLYNALLIFFTLSFSLLFRRRTFFLFLLSAFWFGISFANFIILTYRSMPLTASDIWLLSSVRDIFEKYLSAPVLLLLMLGISAVLGLVFYLWLQTKKAAQSFGFGLTHFLLAGLVLFALTSAFVHLGLLSKTTEYSMLSEAYRKNGFAYSFSASLVTRGVIAPEDYSAPIVQEIYERQQALPATSENTPNIVYVQLESFFDPGYMSQLTLEENPIPNFTDLRERCTSGLLSVPGVGAGTANTEFEVLTGMNLDHFGVGEYPYMTTVVDTPLDSAASALANIGYRSHAIHNNNATFYDRDIVYANLCFDTFTSIEYMNGVEYNPLGWAKDTVLTGEILKALRSTPGRDFVFAVSVQPHGKYPSEPIDGAPTVGVSGMDDEARATGFSYFLGQLRQTDAMIAELLAAVSALDEPTVVVFYGDHLPSFNIQLEELSYGDNQTTEYVLWANYDLAQEKRDLQTYQLTAYVFERCGIHEGAMFREHQLFSYAPETDRAYVDELIVLEYDLIDGEHFSPYPSPSATQLRFGVSEIVLSSVRQETAELEQYLLRGKNFTPYSVVFINDEAYPTQFVHSGLLRLTDVTLTQGDVITVAQVSATDTLVLLSQTEPISWEE